MSFYQENRPEQKRFYSGKKWRKLRDMYLAEHPLCERCLQAGRAEVAEHVHHKIEGVTARELLHVDHQRAVRGRRFPVDPLHRIARRVLPHAAQAQRIADEAADRERVAAGCLSASKKLSFEGIGRILAALVKLNDRLKANVNTELSFESFAGAIRDEIQKEI